MRDADTVFVIWRDFRIRTSSYNRNKINYKKATVKNCFTNSVINKWNMHEMHLSNANAIQNNKNRLETFINRKVRCDG